jgi:hypothetical protein
MLSLEEYIEKRKTEDGINEFDVSQKINNIRTCINCVQSGSKFIKEYQLRVRN